MRYRFLFILVMSLLLCGLFSSGAYAQTLVEELKKPMPEYEMVDQNDFEKKSTFYEQTPFNDEFLAYSVRLPKNWKRRDNAQANEVNLSNKILGDIDYYYGPARLDERSYFSVQAVELEYKLTAEQWLALLVLENGYTLEGMEVVNNNRVNIQYALVKGHTEYKVVASAITSGKRVIFVQYVVPEKFWMIRQSEEQPLDDLWQEERSYARRVVDSFELENIDDSTIENFVTHQFLDVAQMKYPDSWKLVKKPLKSADQISVDLFYTSRINSFSTAEILKGKMQVHLFTDYAVDDIQEDIVTFRDSVRIEKLAIENEIEEIEDFVIDETMDLVEVKVYEAASSSGQIVDYEFWMAVMYGDGYYYYLTLLTPARDTDYLSWARNTQTMRSVAKTLQPYEE